jgi:macrolide-specific efflux system membrane fusion protein
VKRRLGITLLVITSLVLVAVALVVQRQRTKAREAAQIETAIVIRRDINATVQATGIIKPMVGAEVKVGSRISGVVRQLLANIGDSVKPGQVIAELDDAEFRAKLNQSTAALAKVQASMEYARVTLERQRALRERDFVPQQEMDLAENGFRVARAQVEQAEADVEYARLQLSYTRIRAPIAGVVASVTTQEGEAVSTGLATPTFVTIIDLERLEVDVYVDETDVGKISVGQDVGFTVDAYPEADFAATIVAIYPEAVIQDNVVNYVAAARITDFQGKVLRPEMTANALIRLGTHPAVLAVPSAAIMRDRGQKLLTVVERDRLVARPVTTGWSDGGYTEIVSGVSEGERIVVSRPEE